MSGFQNLSVSLGQSERSKLTGPPRPPGSGFTMTKTPMNPPESAPSHILTHRLSKPALKAYNGMDFRPGFKITVTPSVVKPHMATVPSPRGSRGSGSRSRGMRGSSGSRGRSRPHRVLPSRARIANQYQRYLPY